MYDNDFKTKGNKIWTKDKIEPQHLHWLHPECVRVTIKSNLKFSLKYFHIGYFLCLLALIQE